jgi:curved DNA-binding protein
VNVFMMNGRSLDEAPALSQRVAACVRARQTIGKGGLPAAACRRLHRLSPDHYATLGLDRDCTTEQVRTAYRLLAKRLHPDVNRTQPDAVAQMQALNAAYEVLVDGESRAAYDRELRSNASRPRSKASRQPTLSEDVYLRLEEFFRGTTLEVRVNDPANPSGPETYPLEVPAQTAPGTRFKLKRSDGSAINVRVRVRPDHRFKVRGSDLRCDLRISPQRAALGGTEFIAGPTGSRTRVDIPRAVARGHVIRVSGEGLPNARGGRGDLLLRVMYRPQVQIRRATRG